MASLNHDHEGHGLILVKGAPERLLEMCRRQRVLDGDAELDPAYWHRRADAIASRGQRLLAVAVKETDSRHSDLRFADVEGDLVFLGLLGLIDPPREEAIAAVAECRSAGIRVKMITGDHAATASAIARQLGLDNPHAVLTGSDLDRLDDDALRSRAGETNVFARTSPEHKLRLVQALQAGGAVVAMTGDGVNDAPALKRADIGIAMGRKGSEAAKEAAEMVLADDNFATIGAAVRAGRTVYDNLKKAIVFLLPINGGESASLIAAILLGMTLPISPVQILWVNMVSSVGLAMALAFEPAERDVMKRPPRAPDEPILSAFLVWRILLVSTLFLAGIFGQFALAEAQGANLEEARTIAVNTLVAMEIFYLFSVRYLYAPSISLRGAVGTRAVLIAVGAVAGLQFLFTYTPFMETFFDSRPLDLIQGLQVAAVGIALLVVLEIEKRLRVLIDRGVPRDRGRGEERTRRP
jgi:magnesium-transporting ATPase (P-type)